MITKYKSGREEEINETVKAENREQISVNIQEGQYQQIDS